MVSLAIILSIVGIILETFAIYWTGRSLFYNYKKFYNKVLERAEGKLLAEQYKAEKKEQFPIIILLTVGAVLQIVALLIQ